MKVETSAGLTCSACGVDGPHELLYLSEHLRASRCKNCGYTRVYSHHIYVDYTKDVAERSVWLPFNLGRKALRNPAGALRWPIKAFYAPFKLLKEANQVTSFRRGSRERGESPGDGARR